MKTKVVQHVRRIIFNVFKVFEFSSFQVFRFSGYQVFQNIPGSQLLSDIQTFLAGNQLYFQVFKFLFFVPSSTRQVWRFKFVMFFKVFQNVGSSYSCFLRFLMLFTFSKILVPVFSKCWFHVLISKVVKTTKCWFQGLFMFFTFFKLL